MKIHTYNSYQKSCFTWVCLPALHTFLKHAYVSDLKLFNEHIAGRDLVAFCSLTFIVRSKQELKIDKGRTQK